MNSFTLRSCAALICAAGLAGCGGGHGTLQLGGSVRGVSTEGLSLTNNGGPPLVIPADNTGGFVFPELIASDTSYDVEFASLPEDSKCSIAYNKGNTGAYSVSTVAVTCALNQHALGGPVTGLVSDGLVVVNGSDQMSIPAHATHFSMTVGAPPQIVTGLVPFKSAYGVTVLHQPATGTCTVIDGVGHMGKVDIDNIHIDCH
ncbi:MAG: hypothetical protein V4582_07495 [Pseudomonadota bacterium]